MDKLVVLGVLIVATSLEATGDAVVRMGIAQNAWVPRSLLFMGGTILLFGYGLSVNLAPVEFGRVVGVHRLANCQFRCLPIRPQHIYPRRRRAHCWRRDRCHILGMIISY